MSNQLTIKYQGRYLHRIGAFWFFFGSNNYRKCFLTKQEARSFVEQLNKLYNSRA